MNRVIRNILNKDQINLYCTGERKEKHVGHNKNISNFQRKHHEFPRFFSMFNFPGFF